MGVIGEQIKKIRIEKGITQEQLGQLVGVTTQAVSRWERGGTPDAEVLPLISEALGVGVDALFGREEQSLAMALARKLCLMPQEEAYSYAFSLCWAIELGLLGDVTILDDFMNRFLGDKSDGGDVSMDYFAKIITDSGIANARMSPDFRSFFLMVSPKDGTLKDKISDFEALRGVFEVFSDENVLKIVLYLHSKSIIPVASSLIGKSLGLSLREVERCMELLCVCGMAERSVVETVDGDMTVYNLRKESFFIPMMCFADEIAKKNVRPFWGTFNRTKPFY